MTVTQYRYYLNRIEMSARSAACAAQMLPNRPAFETNAEAELAEARKVLTEALENVIKAQAIYQRKPVDA